MSSKQRHYQDTLRIIGAGVIVLGIWSILRTLLLFSFDRRYMQVLTRIAGEEVPMIVVYVAIAMTMGTELVLRLYVGLTARADAAGKKKTILYLCVTGFMMINRTVALVDSVRHRATSYVGLDDFIAALVIDLTSLFALGCLLYFGICLRRYRSSVSKEEKTQ